MSIMLPLLLRVLIAILASFNQLHVAAMIPKAAAAANRQVPAPAEEPAEGREPQPRPTIILPIHESDSEEEFDLGPPTAALHPERDNDGISAYLRCILVRRVLQIHARRALWNRNRITYIQTRCDAAAQRRIRAVGTLRIEALCRHITSYAGVSTAPMLIEEGGAYYLVHASNNEGHVEWRSRWAMEPQIPMTISLEHLVMRGLTEVDQQARTVNLMAPAVGNRVSYIWCIDRVIWNHFIHALRGNTTPGDQQWSWTDNTKGGGKGKKGKPTTYGGYQQGPWYNNYSNANFAELQTLRKEKAAREEELKADAMGQTIAEKLVNAFGFNKPASKKEQKKTKKKEKKQKEGKGSFSFLGARVPVPAAPKTAQKIVPAPDITKRKKADRVKNEEKKQRKTKNARHQRRLSKARSSMQFTASSQKTKQDKNHRRNAAAVPKIRMMTSRRRRKTAARNHRREESFENVPDDEAWKEVQDALGTRGSDTVDQRTAALEAATTQEKVKKTLTANKLRVNNFSSKAGGIKMLLEHIAGK